MVQTANYTRHLEDKGFKSIERGHLDKIINIQNQNGQQFRMELVPHIKAVNIIPPNGTPQRVKYSNMGDFGTKSAQFINNWNA